MEKITFGKNPRPKSAKICYNQHALTETNNNYNCSSKKNSSFPCIRENITKKYFNKSRTKFRNIPEYSYSSFLKSSTPFNYFRNKNNKNEFFICFNGGPRQKFSFPSKKLSLNMSKISNNFSNFTNYNSKNYNFCVTNYNKNNKEKIKYNNIYNNIEEEKNIENNINKRYINPILNTEKNTFKLNDINNKKKCEEKKCEKEKEKIVKNYFKIKKGPKCGFHKIQIHNNCKPFLVDDYRYYAEKYLNQ